MMIFINGKPGQWCRSAVLKASPPAPGRAKVHPMANAWTMPGWHGPPARPAGLPARLSGAGRTGGNALRMPKERLTRSVRRGAGRYGPVARAPLVCNRSIMPDFSANSEVGNEIEKPCRAPSAVGRVTPCTPRRQPAGAKLPRRRPPDPLPIKTFLEFPVPTWEFGFSAALPPAPPAFFPHLAFVIRHSLPLCWPLQIIYP